MCCSASATMPQCSTCRADRELVVAMDTIVEGVHFPDGTAAADIGYRALAVNLSDLAAMGAEPAWMTLSLSLPDSDEPWLDGFRARLVRARRSARRRARRRRHGARSARRHGADRRLGRSRSLADARRARSRAICCSFPACPARRRRVLHVIQRAHAGDGSDRASAAAIPAPEPRVALGRSLRTIATAAMDVSDGLLTDLDKLCAASGCGARIDVDALPSSAAMLRAVRRATLHRLRTGRRRRLRADIHDAAGRACTNLRSSTAARARRSASSPRQRRAVRARRRSRSCRDVAATITSR